MFVLVKKVVTLKSLWANHCHTPRIHSKNKNQADSPENKVKVEPKSLLIDGAIKVDENDDDDSSSTVSTTSDTTSLDSEVWYKSYQLMSSVGSLINQNMGSVILCTCCLW